jgi:hypothetical protein
VKLNRKSRIHIVCAVNRTSRQSWDTGRASINICSGGWCRFTLSSSDSLLLLTLPQGPPRIASPDKIPFFNLSEKESQQSWRVDWLTPQRRARRGIALNNYLSVLVLLTLWRTIPYLESPHHPTFLAGQLTNWTRNHRGLQWKKPRSNQFSCDTTGVRGDAVGQRSNKSMQSFHNLKCKEAKCVTRTSLLPYYP